MFSKLTRELTRELTHDSTLTRVGTTRLNSTQVLRVYPDSSEHYSQAVTTSNIKLLPSLLSDLELKLELLKKMQNVFLFTFNIIYLIDTNIGTHKVQQTCKREQ